MNPDIGSLPAHLLDVTPRVSLMVVAAFLVTRLIRSRTSHTTQNAVWGVVLVGAALLPILSPLLPTWEARVLPAPDPSPIRMTSGALFEPTAPPVPPVEAVIDEWAERPAPDPRRRIGWRGAFAGAWFIGVLAALWAPLRGLRRLSARAAHAPSTRLRASFGAERVAAGVGRRVRLVIHPNPVPMTWGLWRPVVAVPPAAESWSDARTRVVFRHELAHVRRADWGVHVLARCTCALQWFNPFVWWAARAWRDSCEQACDEFVVHAGTRASEYAEHLVAIAATVSSPTRSPAALPVVHSPNLEDRIMSILRAPRPVGRARVVAPALVALLVVAVAATSPARRVPPPTTPPAPPAPPSLPSLSSVPAPPLLAGIETHGSGLSYRWGPGDEAFIDLTDRRIGLRMQVEGRTTFEEGEVVDIDADAEIYLSARRNGTRLRARITGDDDGRPLIDWRVGREDRPVDDDARAWIRSALVVAELHMERSSLVAHRDGLRAEIDGIRAERDGLRAEIDGVQARRDGLLATIDGARARRDGLRAEIDGVYAEREGLRAELEHLDRERDVVEDRLARLEERDADADRIARTRATLEDIDTAVRRLEERIDRTDTDGRVAELERRIEELRVEEETGAIRARVDDLDVEGRTAEIERRIADLRVDERADRLREEIDALNVDERVDAIRQELEAAYTDFDRWTERLTSR